ncbi:MAG: amidase, partial [Mesorhizobium sp.]
SATVRASGPMESSVADAVMAGQETVALVPLPFAGLRIGIPRGALFEDTEKEVSAAFERCVRKVELAGAYLADLSIDDLLADLRGVTKRASIAAMEGAEVHADWLATGATTPEPLSRAAAVPATAYIRAIRRRTALVAAMDERLVSVDVLALPTTPVTAPTIVSMTRDEALCGRTKGLLLRNTQVAN